MAWRIVEVADSEATEADLTDSELVGVSILLTHYSGLPRSDMNVYWRAKVKIRPQVAIALDNQRDD